MPRSSRASDEVMRGRLVLLGGFSFVFRAKNEEWRDLQLVSQMTFESQWMAERIGSTPIDQNNHVCAFLLRRNRNPPITTTSVTFRPSLCHASRL